MGTLFGREEVRIGCGATRNREPYAKETGTRPVEQARGGNHGQDKKHERVGESFADDFDGKRGIVNRRVIVCYDLLRFSPFCFRDSCECFFSLRGSTFTILFCMSPPVHAFLLLFEDGAEKGKRNV